MTKVLTVNGFPRYPWDEWFSRGKFQVLKGRDYNCKTHGMAAQIRNCATRRGIRVSLSMDDDGIEVRVVGPKKRRRKSA